MFGGKEQIIAKNKRAERERAGGESGAPALPSATSNATLAMLGKEQLLHRSFRLRALP